MGVEPGGRGSNLGDLGPHAHAPSRATNQHYRYNQRSARSFLFGSAVRRQRAAWESELNLIVSFLRPMTDAIWIVALVAVLGRVCDLLFVLTAGRGPGALHNEIHRVTSWWSGNARRNGQQRMQI